MLEYSKSYGMCIVLICFGKNKLCLNFIYPGDSEMSMSNCFSVIVLDLVIVQTHKCSEYLLGVR